jgi:hypothetical protein
MDIWSKHCEELSYNKKRYKRKNVKKKCRKRKAEPFKLNGDGIKKLPEPVQSSDNSSEEIRYGT